MFLLKMFQSCRYATYVKHLRAQIHLLGDPNYQHPAYWAPFLLINNWL